MQYFNTRIGVRLIHEPVDLIHELNVIGEGFAVLIFVRFFKIFLVIDFVY